MKKALYILVVILMGSCAEKLIEEPKNLIAKDKMIDIFNDLAILKAAKTTNVMVLRNHGIEPMSYIYSKYNIDSLQFVESDRYYASIPREHEEIYVAVTEKLGAEEERLSDVKKERDSLKKVKKDALLKNKKMTKDSLSRTGGKKTQ